MQIRKKKKTEWKPEGQNGNIAKLRDEPYRQIFKCRVKGIMSDNNHDLLGFFKGMLKACDDAC